MVLLPFLIRRQQPSLSSQGALGASGASWKPLLLGATGIPLDQMLCHLRSVAKSFRRPEFSSWTPPAPQPCASGVWASFPLILDLCTCPCPCCPLSRLLSLALPSGSPGHQGLCCHLWHSCSITSPCPSLLSSAGGTCAILPSRVSAAPGRPGSCHLFFLLVFRHDDRPLLSVDNHHPSSSSSFGGPVPCLGQMSEYWAPSVRHTQGCASASAYHPSAIAHRVSTSCPFMC